MDEYNINPLAEENKKLIRNIFSVKRVPLNYIKRIVDYREFHRENFEASLKNTVSKDTDLKGFDYYFDYVVEQFGSIQL